MAFLHQIWTYAVYVFWYLLPGSLRPESFLAKAQVSTDEASRKVSAQRVARVVFWLLNLAFVLVMVWALWQLNRSYDLERVLRSPWRWLHPFWLPGLFLLLYSLFWLGWWLLRLLVQVAEAESFPDIENAWDAADKALRRAGLDPTELPLFLVLGRPTRDVDDLFAGAELSLQVRHEPVDPNAPLHVYAGPSGVFVTCEGASLTGRASQLLGHDPGEESTRPPEELSAGLTDPTYPLSNGNAKRSAPEEDEAAVRAAERARTTLLLEEEEASSPTAPRRRLLVLQNADENERLLARLKFLCRLLVRRRQPYCPVNGILLLIPVAATDSASEAAQTGALISQDLSAARQTLQVHCPVQTLVCDLETVPGFAELLRRLPGERQRHQLFGRRFPLLPRLADAELPAMLDGGVKWLCRELMASVVFRVLRLEGTGGEDVRQAVTGNARLARFLGEWYLRQPNLSRILVQALSADPGDPMLLAGCYLGATGPDSARQQAFVPGVFRLLIESQNYVFWTRQADDDEKHYRRLTRITYAAAVLMALTVVCLVWFVWYGS